MLIDSKSQLAKLLATENLIVEQQNVPTAFFHVKDRRLVIPILSSDLSTFLYDLFIGHEVGHAMHTPLEGWHDSIVDLKIPRSIINVVEDARIEKLVKRKYPGIRTSFVKAYRELMERDFFEIKGIDVNKLNLIDRINLHFKVGVSLGIRFSANEREFVTELENLETWEDTIAAAQKILAHMKEEAERKKQEESMAKMSSVDDDDDESYEERDNFDVFGDEEPELSEDENGDISAAEKDEEDEEQEDDGGKQGGESFDDELKAHTDEAFREHEKELISDEKREHIYANIPTVHLQNIIIPYKQIIQKLKTCKNPLHSATKSMDFLTDWDGNLENHLFAEFRNKSNKIVSYLVKEFELRKNAQQMKKASTAKTGDLDMKRIHTYMYNEDIFKRVTNVPNGKSHGLVMFIDWSGSMADYMEDTVKQLLNLVLFCRKINIPFEVYAFSNKNGNETLPSFTCENGDLRPNRFHLLNLFSNKMSINELSYIANCLLKMTRNRGNYYAHLNYPEFMQLHGTPLNEAIIAAMKLIPEFRNTNKLQIVNTVFLTDGDATVIDDMVRNEIVNGNTYNTGSSIFSSWRSDVVPVIRHRQTGLVEKVVFDKKECAIAPRKHTAAYLNLLKKVADCNVIGFYLLNNRDAKNFLNSNIKNQAVSDSMYSDFRKEKSVVIKSEGYDEYYLMKADTKVDETDEIVAKSNTTRGLVSAFTKYSNTRFTNRVVLSKFIGMIS